MTDEPHSADMMTDEEIFEWHADSLAEANRQHRLDGGHALGLMLGTPEGRAQLDAAGWRDGQTIVLMLPYDDSHDIRRRLTRHDQPVLVAVYDPETAAITFRTVEQALFDA